MAKQGQQLSPLPTEQVQILGGQEKDQPVTETITFPNISLRLFYDKWHSLTSDAEVLNLVTGQPLEFSQTLPVLCSQG